jgi:hypothetical protein
MQTVVETPSYLASAKAEGMTEIEMKAAVDMIAGEPQSGAIIVGSGGCRKVRLAGKGRGKSGGYRVVTVYGGNHMPVFLLWVLSKGSAANFTDAQVKAMAKAAKAIVASGRPSRVQGPEHKGDADV